MDRGREPLLRIGQVVLELSAQLVLAIGGAVMRRRRQEVLFNALNCPSRDLSESGVKVRYVRLDANTSVSIPFDSTKTQR